jgi:protein-S-isoprenylcysteine O-methyltransferase Ste14
MSPLPDFEFGLWNAWIVVVAYLAASFVPMMLGGKQAEARMEDEPGFREWDQRSRVGVIIDHAVLMPLTLLYSFVVPLERGNWWLYSGLVISALAIVMAAAASIVFTTAALGGPMTGGIYAFSRHPMYVSGILLYAGVGLAGTSWVFLLCAVVDVVAWYLAMPEEEQNMIAKYGAAYEDYLRRTPRWIGLPKRRELGDDS